MTAQRMRVVVAGDTLAGLSTAAALARFLPAERYSVELVPIGHRDVEDCVWTVATLPAAREFHAGLGIDVRQLVERCGGSFGLGTAYSGWSATLPTFFDPFGETGVGMGGAPFHHLAARLREAGEQVNLADYSLAAMLAQAGRFAPPAKDPDSPLSTYGYGLHLNAADYRRLLAELAAANGVRLHRQPIAAVRRSEDGAVAALELDNGDTVAGDFFVDSTGTAALLASAGFESWRESLRCDRLLTLLCTSPVAPSPYVHVAAHSAGWRSTVPSRSEIGEAFGFDSEAVSDVSAKAELRAQLLGPAASDPAFASFEPGRRARPWDGNCVAIGSAAAVLEPGFALSLHLVHSAIGRLLKLFPLSRDCAVEAREYNRLTVAELDCARDWVAVRYRLNGRRGERFWDTVRAVEPSAALARKIDLYRARGRLPLIDGDLFDGPEWALLLDSLGLRPERIDVLAAAIPIDDIKAQLARLRQLLIAVVKTAPPHGDHLRRLSPRAAA